MIGQRTHRAAFLPTALYEVVPEFEGTSWWAQSRPLLFWFILTSDNRFGLILEVGPFSSETFPREALVKKLLEHFKSNIKVYPKFTRVYSEHRRMTDEQVSDPEQLLTAMKNMYDHVAGKRLVAVAQILGSYFRSRKLR